MFDTPSENKYIVFHRGRASDAAVEFFFISSEKKATNLNLIQTKLSEYKNSQLMKYFWPKIDEILYLGHDIWKIASYHIPIKL